MPRSLSKNWALLPKIPLALVKTLSDFHPLFLQIAYNRGIINLKKTKKENLKVIEAFLNPDYELHLYNPFLMKGMEEGVERIIQALSKKEKVAIFGDYDVDGVTSTVILKEILDQLKIPNIYYIPSRKEGYGLNKEALEKLAKKKINLLIAVDCGISNHEEIEFLKKKGIEVIVLDHHSVETKAHRCIVINPKQKDCPYPFKELAAVGIVFKLVQALVFKLPSYFPVGWEKWLLDLVALGTVCDIVPLIDENRVLVKYGLKVFSKTKREGLKALADLSGFSLHKIGTETMGFYLGPRINAAGRIDHAHKALDLLLTQDKEESKRLALYLNQLNQKRQSLTDKIISQARFEIELSEKDFPVLVLHNKDWPSGIVGIVASKLNQEYNRPVVVLEKGESFSRGSIRSIEDFDLTFALKQCKKYLLRYGGHKKAAGISIKNQHINSFKEKICAIAEKSFDLETIMPKLNIDTKASLDQIFDIFEELKKFAPYGHGNLEPVFYSQGIEILNSKMVGKNNNHLKLKLKSKKGRETDAIGFNLKPLDKNIQEMVFKISEDLWNGYPLPILKLLDFK